ncbi:MULTISPECIES: DUF6580 family putative transport protein [unclassified Lysobacter]|uniref:DUF6580 family putative transport protein n=1 Tax=unclassified Lysobacter TaxID=2635362 RepID=UPI001C2277D9|nr:DUF6580 family putative transport protein [Lysobacter sp. MMG2]MBU8975423.1 hypothetical protein [Lysobacter sp. MMG2]
MNRPVSTSPATPASSSLFAPGPLVLIGMIVIAALSRLLPHPPNFSPVEAVALFGGAYFASRALAIAIPLVAMLLSDVILGLTLGGTYFEHFTSSTYLVTWLSVYVCIALSAALGFGLRGRVSGARVLGYSLMGSVLFFVVTNFAVWATATPVNAHPACMTGLMPCYAAALPFFQWTVLGTLFYAAILFGGFALLRQRVPALRAQTV